MFACMHVNTYTCIHACTLTLALAPKRSHTHNATVRNS